MSGTKKLLMRLTLKHFRKLAKRPNDWQHGNVVRICGNSYTVLDVAEIPTKYDRVLKTYSLDRDGKLYGYTPFSGPPILI